MKWRVIWTFSNDGALVRLPDPRHDEIRHATVRFTGRVRDEAQRPPAVFLHGQDQKRSTPRQKVPFIQRALETRHAVMNHGVQADLRR